MWMVKIGVSVGLLYVLVRYQHIDVGAVWDLARNASIAWLLCALALYFVVALISTWRWHLLLTAQHISVSWKTLMSSFLVASFFNNFLPSNIGGDVFRIAVTAKAAGSRTVAATVILLDRVIGVIGLLFVAAIGASQAARSGQVPDWMPMALWLGFVAVLLGAVLLIFAPRFVLMALHPLRLIHQEWVEARIADLTSVLTRFQSHRGALVATFCGAVGVQLVLILFYAAIADALHITVPIVHIAILIPVSFVVQMAPISLNGLGVREQLYKSYLTRVGVSAGGALALSLMGMVVIMVFSLMGAVAYASRKKTTAGVPVPGSAS